MAEVKTMTLSEMIGSLLTIVVGIVLIPIIYNQLETANITDPAVAGILALVPFFFAIGLVYTSLKPYM